MYMRSSSVARLKPSIKREARILRKYGIRYEIYEGELFIYAEDLDKYRELVKKGIV